MLRIAVCDDEEQFRRRIGKEITDFLTKQAIVFQIDNFCSGEEFIELEEKMKKYDLIFLDISMGEVDGITVAKKLREYSRKTVIVFITAFLDYSLEGYKVNAIRYLLKSSQNLKLDMEECMETVLEEINFKLPRKVFHFREEEKEVNLYNIVYIESRLHILEFHIVSGNCEKIYTMYGNMNKLEAELQIQCFMRIHQSYIVNLRYVKEMKKGNLTLKDGTTLIVPRVRCKEVEKAIAAYKGEK